MELKVLIANMLS